MPDEPPPKKLALEVDPTVVKVWSVSGLALTRLCTCRAITSMSDGVAPGGPWMLT